MRSLTKVFRFKVSNLVFSKDGQVSDGEKLVIAELDRAEEYKKTLLTRVEAPARQAFIEKRWELCPELALLEQQANALSAQIDAIYDEIRANNQKARGLTKTPEQAERLEALKAARKEIWERAKPVRAAANKLEDLKLASKRFSEEKNEKKKQFRSEAGIHWGTYQRVEEAVDVSVKNQTGPIKFGGLKGKGGVALHFQNGDVKTIEQIFNGKSAKFKLERPHLRPTSGRRFMPSRLEMKIGKPHDGVLSCQAIVHRELPESGKLLWAVVQREQVGSKWEFFALLTIKYEVEDRKSKGKVCVVVPSVNDIHGDVAAVLYEGGRAETISLAVSPTRTKNGETVTLVDRFNHELPKTRADQEFNSTIDFLSDWIATNRVPEWLAKEAEYMAKWRSHRKLEKLLWKWKDARFDGDHDVFDFVFGTKPSTQLVGKWDPPKGSRAHIKHLDDQYSNEQAYVLRRRREEYRIWAKKLATENDVVVIGDLELKKKALVKDRQDERDIAPIRANRQNVALSELKECLAKACKNEGSLFVYKKGSAEELMKLAIREREQLGGAPSTEGARSSETSETIADSSEPKRRVGTAKKAA